MGSFLGGLVGHSPGFLNWKSIDLLSAIASRLPFHAKSSSSLNLISKYASGRERP